MTTSGYKGAVMKNVKANYSMWGQIYKIQAQRMDSGSAGQEQVEFNGRALLPALDLNKNIFHDNDAEFYTR